MADELSILAAFIAGLLSFLSPCVFPLIPSYLSFLSGSEADTLATFRNNSGWRQGRSISLPFHRRLIVSTLCFTAGFSTVFVFLNILISGSVLLLGGLNRVINIIAGVLVIFLGLNMLFDFIPFLSYEKRFHPAKRPRRFLGSFLAGLAFGAGWTPCVGPILGSILIMAGSGGSLSRSVLYLSVYSLGLGLPFLLSAVLWGSVLTYLAKMRRFLPVIKNASGILIIAIGIAIALGAYGSFPGFFTRAGIALGAWAEGGGFSRYLIQAGVFLFAGLLPVLVRALRRNPPLSPATLVFLCLCTLFGISHALGLFNAAALISHWFFFQGI
ncbi:MAG: cytochrome c biogenesis CcdA family protein [Treponema sp.]|jgi:cytochrome c-type biogenesis protein|nr:cytochrome c biogenesis CcdA family protein [Treponema sp.]